MERDGGVGGTLQRVDRRKSKTDKVASEQRTEGNEGLNHVDMWERSIPG